MSGGVDVIEATGDERLLARLARGEPRALAIVLIPAFAFFVMFFRWFIKQHEMSMASMEDWGHAYIVPLVCGFYIWTKRKEILSVRSRVYWPGLATALLGVVTYLYFVLVFPNHMFQGLSLVLTVSGLVLLLGGTRVFGALFFPVAYLALGITISEQVMLALTFPLKQFAAAGGDMLLNLLTIETSRAPGSNLIYVLHSDSSKPAIPLNIEDACSGMRMVIAFVALGTAVAFLSCRFWWQRISLLLLTVPVALGMNIVRVAALGIAGLFDSELAGGDSHTFIGMLLLFPSLGIFMGCVWLLNKAVVEDEGQPAKGAKAPPKTASKVKANSKIAPPKAKGSAS